MNIFLKKINFELISDEKAIEICSMLFESDKFTAVVKRFPYYIIVDFGCRAYFICSNSKIEVLIGNNFGTKAITVFNPEAYNALLDTQWVKYNSEVSVHDDKIIKFSSSCKYIPVIIKKNGCIFEGKYVFYKSGTKRFEASEFQMWEDDVIGVPDFWILKSNIV